MRERLGVPRHGGVGAAELVGKRDGETLGKRAKSPRLGFRTLLLDERAKGTLRRFVAEEVDGW